MQVNAQALRETMDKVLEVAPYGGHNQNYWVALSRPTEDWCGTVACFAGWRALQDGWELETDAMLPVLQLTGHEDMPLHFTETYARKRFGLNHANARILFYCNNTLTELKDMVDLLCAGQDLVDHETYGDRATW